MTDNNSHSFAQKVLRLLFKYDLPSIYTLIHGIPPKSMWKALVQKSTDHHWKDKLLSDRKSKVSIKYLDLDKCDFNKVHPV